jgi:hypothetical protein
MSANSKALGIRKELFGVEVFSIIVSINNKNPYTVNIKPMIILAIPIIRSISYYSIRSFNNIMKIEIDIPIYPMLKLRDLSILK